MSKGKIDGNPSTKKAEKKDKIGLAKGEDGAVTSTNEANTSTAQNEIDNKEEATKEKGLLERIKNKFTGFHNA